MQDNKDDEGITIDLSRLKNIFKKKKKDDVNKIESQLKQTEQDLKEEIDKEEKIIHILKEDKENITNAETDIKEDRKLAKSIDTEEEILEKGLEEDKKAIEKTKRDIEKIKTSEIPKQDESINIDKIKEVFKEKEWGAFFKRYGMILVILIPIFFSIFFRMYPSYLPITDQWAENSVYNAYKSEIRAQIDQQYPNLPDANKNTLVNTEFEKVLNDQKNQIDEQIQGTSNYFKSKFKDDDGQTYLLAIDPYLWYGQARNYINYGHTGNKIVNGTSVYTLRNGRLNNVVSKQLHPILEAQLYKIIHMFNKNFTLLRTSFLMPVILIALSVIPAFFIAKKFGGILGGFFAGMIIALNTSLLGRTPAGFSDTDAYNILLPLIIVWVFLSAFETSDLKKKVSLTVLAGFFTGLFCWVWSNGWSYVFNFVIATIGIYILYICIANIKELKKGILHFLSLKEIKLPFMTLGIYLLSSGIFVSWLKGFNYYLTGFTRTFSFIRLKEVGVKTIWPNVLTTVAEFNPPQLIDIINQMGGRLLFAIAIAGIIWTLFKKNEEGKIDIKYAILLIIWFLGTAYAFTKGVRFAILMVPAFAIAFGIAMGNIYSSLRDWMSKELHINKIMTSTVMIIMLLLTIGISPIPVSSTNLPFCTHGLCEAAHSTALNEIPSMSDVWYDSLTAIKEDSEDGIITSWWDFGHWFVTIAERRVTFDGADQGKRIHWVGKSLLVDDEEENIGILKMLNCGQESAFGVLDSYVKNGVKSIDILNEIILLDKQGAKDILLKNGLTEEQSKSVLELTHCDDLIEQYYITSEDMIGKAGVWAHFGSWDFKRAKMWQSVVGKDYDEGTTTLEKEFNLTPELADNYYYEIQNTKADQWISPWPSYRSGLSGCTQKNNMLECSNGALINLTSYDAELPTREGIKYPDSLVYNTEDDLIEKEYQDDIMPISIVLIKEGENYVSLLCDPPLAKSMFTRLFFFNGLGLKHYSILSDQTTVTGQRVIVWKVNWEEGKAITNKKEIVKEGDTVTVAYTGWLEDETIFDSSIVGWEEKGITKDTEFNDDQDQRLLTFKVGSGQVISGFDDAVIGLKINQTKTIDISPDKAYGLDPKAHPLGNESLNFKIKIIKIE